MCNQLN